MLDRLAEVGAHFRAIKGFWAFAYCAFLGVLSALAFPPYPFVPLFFVAIVLLLLLLSGEERVSRAFGYGFFFGAGQFGFSLSWITNSFFVQSDVPLWLAPIMVSLLVVILSLFPGMATLITRLLWHRYWPQRAMAFASLYMAFEFTRGLIFPWNPTSLIWWPADVMLQTLSVGGSLGLGLLTIVAAGLFAPLFDGAWSARTRLITPTTGLLIMGIMAGLGAIRLKDSNPSFEDGLVVRLVQPAIPQVEKWDPRFIRRNLDKHISLSTLPPGLLGRPEIIVWSETAVPYDLENQPTREFIMANFPGQILLTGAVRNVLEPVPELTNSLYVLGGQGNILARYDKARLVPFGEWVPGRKFLGTLGLETLVPGSTDYQEGPGLQTIALAGYPSFSPLVCYEVIFSGNVVIGEDNPGWILNITNDAWFGNSAGPRQHFQMARERAIEEGMPVIRVAGTGISAVIDPFGRVLERLDLNEEGIIDSRLPGKTPTIPIFKSLGFLPMGGLAAVFFLIGAGSGRPERPRKEENT